MVICNNTTKNNSAFKNLVYYRIAYRSKVKNSYKSTKIQVFFSSFLLLPDNTKNFILKQPLTHTEHIQLYSDRLPGLVHLLCQQGTGSIGVDRHLSSHLSCPLSHEGNKFPFTTKVCIQEGIFHIGHSTLKKSLTN